MYISKRFLNEQTQKKVIHDSYNFSNSIKSHYDIFLSYSFYDIDYAKKIYQLLLKHGFSVYADFIDNSFSRKNVNKVTAEKLIFAMKKCDSLVYIHSKSSKDSKWCPWEIGLASGINNFKCAILPLIEDYYEFDRQEYLMIYPVIELRNTTTGIEKLWAFEGENYNSLNEWIKTGKLPQKLS